MLIAVIFLYLLLLNGRINNVSHSDGDFIFILLVLNPNDAHTVEGRLIFLYQHFICIYSFDSFHCFNPSHIFYGFTVLIIRFCIHDVSLLALLFLVVLVYFSLFWQGRDVLI